MRSKSAVPVVKVTARSDMAAVAREVNAMPWSIRGVTKNPKLKKKDNSKLLDTLIALKDLGNTLIVVEHDEATTKKAVSLLEFTPPFSYNF